MQAMQGDQANFLLHGVFLDLLQRESATTKRVIEAIPAGKGDYRPDPNAMSAMELAWHIASAEMRFLNAVINGEFDFSPAEKPEASKNPQALAAWYAENFQQRIDKVAALSGDQLAKPVDFRGMFQMPAVMYLSFSNNHGVHHRGQLSTYLRPMGGKVPAIYGESYDSKAAKQAAG
ncbi:MAG TPA: DinB family protein [Bryobacteraceae bacterium]|nr:DinB family protein [Bryobacteraceae bacterium]